MIADEADFRSIVQRIVALVGPERIYLLGSYAKGTERDGSDIDLLIVGPSSLPRSYRGKDVGAVLSAFPSRFHLLFYTPQGTGRRASGSLLIRGSRNGYGSAALRTAGFSSEQGFRA